MNGQTDHSHKNKKTLALINLEEGKGDRIQEINAIDVPQPLSNDLWSILFQKVDV